MRRGRANGFSLAEVRSAEDMPQPIFVTPVPREEDIEARIAAAVARAEAELSQVLARAHGEALEAERAEHREEMERVRGECGERLAETVHERFAGMELRVAELATSVTARLLGIVVSEDLAKRAVAQLASSIRKAIGDSEAIQVRVRGPLSLFESLSAALGERSGQLQFTEAPGADLAVSIDDAQFETRLAEWAATIEGILQ